MLHNMDKFFAGLLQQKKLCKSSERSPGRVMWKKLSGRSTIFLKTSDNFYLYKNRY